MTFPQRQAHDTQGLAGHSAPRRRSWRHFILSVAVLAVVFGPATAPLTDASASSVPYQSVDQHSNEVRRLYLAYFLREPDADGAAYWTAQRRQGVSVATISAYFAQSAEFRARYGHLDDRGFVVLVYRNVLGREPDASGLSYWLARMAEGMSRGSVMANFSESAEFKQKTGTADPAPAPSSGGFVERFDGNRGLERFRTGVFHRDVDVQTHGSMSGSWRADHNINNADCGNPHEHSHTVTKANRPGAIYVCRDHMMTTMGDVDGYSIVWFSPNQTFNGQRTVSWDVNSTDLGGRQWWEVAIIPDPVPDLSCISWLPCDIPSHHRDAVIVGNRDNTLRVWSNNAETSPTWQTFCRDREPRYNLETAEACSSKAIRRPWSVTDNGNGTLTIRFREHQWRVSGSFPSGRFRVVFKDHNYTPNKDNNPIGYTWHWDNIVVR
jgi:hypothetical protein